MPEITPFRAVRYNRHPLEKYLAPPYDVISPAQREDYAARDPHNIVHLILPQERKPGDDPRSRYQRAGSSYRQWLSEGTLVGDPLPGLYVLHQEFKHGGKHRVRRGFLARLKLEDFAQRTVLPHEATLPGPKADRLDLLRETRTNLSPLLMLYGDAQNQIPRLLASVTDQVPPGIFSEAGVDHALWTVTDPALCARVVEFMVARTLYIADGHHRYQTSLSYAQEIDAQLASAEAQRSAPLHAGLLLRHGRPRGRGPADPSLAEQSHGIWCPGPRASGRRALLDRSPGRAADVDSDPGLGPGRTEDARVAAAGASSLGGRWEELDLQAAASRPI